MKTLYVAVAFLGAVVVSTGCGGGNHSDAKTEDHAAHAEAEEHAEDGVEFREGKGLKVSEETAKYIGLRIEDVTEGEITASSVFTAQVYRTASEAQFASTAPVASVTAYATAKVEASVAEDLQTGKRTLHLRSANGKDLKGRVSEVLTPFGTGPEAPREVILAVRDESHELTHGSVLTAELRSTDKSSVATVPKSAVLKTAEGAFVYTVSGEFFLRTPVKVGADAGDTAVEIKDGLYTGDQIVTHPIMTLWMAELQAIRGGASCADGH